MKFVQIFLGLCGATGFYAYPWCLVYKQERTDLTKPGNLYESAEMKHKVETLNANASTKIFG